MKRKVIIFTSEFPPGPGGLGNHAHCLANHLHSRGFMVTAISVAREEFDKNPNGSFDYEVEKVSNRVFKPLKYFKLLAVLHKHVRAHEQPTVIGSGMLMLILLGFYSLFQKRFRSMAVGHALDIRPSNYLYKLLVEFYLQRCDRIIAVSNYTAKKVNAKFRGKVSVINNGFDKKFLSSGITKLAGSPSLVTVGTISERKGQEYVVAALPEIVKEYPSVHYHCIGISTYEHLISRVSRKLDVMDKVSIHGVVDDNQLGGMLAGADIFIMLSNHTSDGNFEGFGIAILEANHLGIPAIGSRDSGITDAIQDQYSGILVDEHNAAQIAGAVRTIMNDYAEFSKNAKMHSTKFNWTQIGDDYIKVIDEINPPQKPS